MEEKELLAFKPSHISELKLYFWSVVIIIAGIALIWFLPSLPFWAFLIPFAIAALCILCARLRISSTHYKLTTERFFMRTGIIAQDEEEIELYRIQDVKLNQSIFQRIVGIGDVTIISSDKTTPELHIKGIHRPNSVKETLRTAYRQSRQAEGVRQTELSR